MAEGGLPELIVKDFPPQAPKALELTQPQVYFGELTNDYAIVNTTEEEFDYPAGDENMTTRYESDRGVHIAGLFRRIMFTLRFGDQNILLSGHLNADSRILYGRNIQERARRIAPFLRLDSDPIRSSTRAASSGSSTPTPPARGIPTPSASSPTRRGGIRCSTTCATR